MSAVPRREIVRRRLQPCTEEARIHSGVPPRCSSQQQARRRPMAGSTPNAGSSGASGGAPYSRRLAQLQDEVARAAKIGHTLAWSPPPEAAPRLGAPGFPTPHQSPEEFAGCNRPTGAEGMPAAAEWAELDRQARPSHSWAISPFAACRVNNLPFCSGLICLHLSATWR